MQSSTGLLLASLLMGGPFGPRLVAADQNTKPQIAAEIQRVERSGKIPPASDHAAIVSNAQKTLQSAGEALASDRLYLALERLLQASDLFEGIAEVSAKTTAVQGDFSAFEAEWAKTSRELAALSQQVRSTNWGNSPAAIRALAETALGRSVPLLDGGRGFAMSTGPKDGLFYLGEARAQAKFANFCGSLSPVRKTTAWTPRSLLPELLVLQAKTDAAFQPPRSIDQHPRFIALNSALKLARELDSTKSYYGALYQYLEAVRHYAMLDEAAVDTGSQTQLKADIDAQIAKLAAFPRDQSIPQLFLERAASQATHPDGSAPSADEWRSAHAILTQVLPAYAAAMKSPRPLPTSSGKTVDLTLVRWPYT